MAGERADSFPGCARRFDRCSIDRTMWLPTGSEHLVKKLALAAVAALVYAAACADQPAGPTDPLTPPQIRAAVKIFDLNQRIPVTTPPFISPAPLDNPCTLHPDLITLSGTFQQIMTMWDNDKANLHLAWHASGMDASGNKYRVNNTLQQTGNVPFTFVANVQMISQGPADNWLERVRVHVRKDGNLVFNRYASECRG